MKPYYQDALAAIYHGRAEEVLPQLPKADLVVADPPYGMDFQSSYRKVKHRRIAGDRELPLDLIWLSIHQATRAAYVFCRWDNLPQMPRPKSVLAWVKNNWSMGDLAHEHGRQWEACCFYPKADHEFVKRIPDVIVVDRTGNALHPTQKPVALLKRIVAANVGESLIDPFMGSGTSLVAARELGWRAVGIEVDEAYCEVAAERLRDSDLWIGNLSPEERDA